MTLDTKGELKRESWGPRKKEEGQKINVQLTFLDGEKRKENSEGLINQKVKKWGRKTHHARVLRKKREKRQRGVSEGLVSSFVARYGFCGKVESRKKTKRKRKEKRKPEQQRGGVTHNKQEYKAQRTRVKVGKSTLNLGDQTKWFWGCRGIKTEI